ncbi:MAG: 1-acyl-sn-glycerol-3-phosphate acyltransferase [Defluviitaleaceae bacterium]|nr:1-acyl-sn-glycerol-3-phosphate acyltransferase [Defluviitaleaceae bacterium]
MFYRILVFIIRPIAWLIYGYKSYGIENIPEDGPIIICANHIHGLDCVPVAITNKRTINFIAKKELFKYRFFNWLFTKLNAIPVDRNSADMKAYKETLKRLKDGKAICIFAQGARVLEIDTKAAKQGVALFALMSGAAVVPALITGKYRPFGKLTIRYGLPITLDEYKDVRVKTEVLAEITEKIMEKVSDLSQ